MVKERIRFSSSIEGLCRSAIFLFKMERAWEEMAAPLTADVEVEEWEPAELSS
jgi:hypothetical protein